MRGEYDVSAAVRMKQLSVLSSQQHRSAVSLFCVYRVSEISRALLVNRPPVDFMTTYLSHMSLFALRAIRLGRLDTAGSHLAEGTASPGTVMTRVPTYVASCCTLGPVLHRYPFLLCLYRTPPADPSEWP